ncbi:MAG: hypothetical protein Q7J68_05795 [Thermoplasmata archaeon]|nr:hypothetical protein [Thermoplasmata archaeon]
MEEKVRKLPPIVLVGVGGGGSRILSEGLEKVKNHVQLDRYACLLASIGGDLETPHVFIVDTSSDPKTKGFYTNIPEAHKISLSSSIKGMSRGAGGKPGRALKAVLNEEVSRTLAKELYKPVSDIGPAIVVFMHTADGGTGGGLTPELIQQMAYVLPQSTVFWVFTVMPTMSSISLQGPRTVAPNLGKLLKVVRRIAERDYNEIPFECREAIRATVPEAKADKSYEFRHSRVALFPMSNDHFAQCYKGGEDRVEIREEILNPFPMELLSQALYPFLKYVVSTEQEQKWMQKYWPMGPIDIPDIMAGVQADRPIVTPHLWIDPDGWTDHGPQNVISDLKNGIIHMEKVEGDVDVGLPDSFTFTGSPSALFEFRATSLYCIPVYPEGSKYFDTFGDLISDEWFPMLSGQLKFVGGSDGKKIGVLSHAANLKPQPITRPKDKTLGFDNGLLVTLIFGAIPADFPIWLKAVKDIMKEHKTEEMWELSFYDANDWLNELGRYMGWRDWLTQDYKESRE